jgi:hypothetical protein
METKTADKTGHKSPVDVGIGWYHCAECNWVGTRHDLTRVPCEPDPTQLHSAPTSIRARHDEEPDVDNTPHYEQPMNPADAYWGFYAPGAGRIAAVGGRI